MVARPSGFQFFVFVIYLWDPKWETKLHEKYIFCRKTHETIKPLLNTETNTSILLTHLKMLI